MIRCGNCHKDECPGCFKQNVNIALHRGRGKRIQRWRLLGVTVTGISEGECDNSPTFLRVRSRDGKKVGKVTGGIRDCTLEGCGGIRYGVRWKDGKLTWPCSKGMAFGEKEARIL